MKHFLKLAFVGLFFLLLTISLSACNGLTPIPSDDGRAVPVYQGMVVSESLTTLSQNSALFGRTALLSVEIINQDDPFGELDFGTIEDVVGAEYVITPTEEADYYSEINKDIYITVKLSNPDNFVILSFTLNGVFYQSYQFQEGSDSENLILKVNTGTTRGVKEYTIDALKYVDGSNIKDAVFEGDRTVTVGLAQESAPSAIFSNEVINATSMTLEINLSDLSQVSSLNKVVLYNGVELVQVYDLVTGNNTITFDKLNIHTLYQYAVVTIYDLLDGQNSRLEILGKQAFYTNVILEIDNIVPTQNSISFGITVTDTDQVGEVTAIELYKGDTLVEALTDLNISEFLGLLSNNEYTIKVTYTYDLSDGVDSQTLVVSQITTTVAKTAPLVVIDNIIPTQDSFNFGITVTDVDQVGAVSAIELYKGEALIEALTDLNVREFTGLLSNNEYTIKVSYTYDLSDGVDSQILVFSQNATTISMTTPLVAVDNVVPTQDSVSFGITVTDTDQVGEVTAVELYQSEILIESLADLNTKEFTGLLSNNEYTIKVTYTYDLSDGIESQVLVVSSNTTTLAKTTPVVVVDNVIPTQDSITFGITVTDADQVGEVIAIELYQGETLIETLTDLNVREFIGLFSNNEYTIKLTYTYDLSDGIGSQVLVVSSNATTLAMATPSAIVDNVVSTQNSIGFELTVTDTDQVGEVTAIELFKGETLVEALTNLNVREFVGLLSNNEYTLKVTYTYDLNDGVGSQALIVSQVVSTPKSIPDVGVVFEQQDLNTVTYELFIDDPDAALTLTRIYAVVYLQNPGDPMQPIRTEYELTLDSFGSFSNLDSGNTLFLYIEYMEDLNDGNGSNLITVTKQFTTSKMPISFSSQESISTQDSLTFNIWELNEDFVNKQDLQFNLYNNDKSILISSEFDEQTELLWGWILEYQYTYTNLLSNNTYILVVSYKADLNDGLGLRDFTHEISLNTLAKATPVVAIDNVVPTQDSIGFGITVTDVDQVGVISAIELYQGETLIEALTDLSVREFTGLLSNNEYTIKVTNTYDLNDGYSIREINNSSAYYTNPAYVDVTSITVLNSTAISIGEEVSLRINFSNPDIVTIKAIYINGIRVSISGNVTSSAIVNYIPESAGGNYSLFIEAIEYTANGMTSLQENSPFFEKVITIFGEINVTSLKEESGFIYTVSGQSSTILINLNNPNNYTVSSICLNVNNTEYTYNAADFIDISMESFKVSLNNLYYDTNRITILNMTFTLDGTITKTVDFSSLDLTLFKVNSSDIIEVSTIEQLSNVQNGYIYKIMNNLDATGFNWIPKSFNGVIYGNGYSIQNLSITVNNLSTSQQKIGIFTEFSGAIIDLKFDNTYISVNTKGDVVLGTIAALSKEYSQFNNISIDNITIRVTSDNYTLIGGVIGQSNISFFDRVSVSNIQIFAKSNDLLRVGGLIGSGGGYQIAYVKNSFVENMYAELEFNTNYSAVAGIIGEGYELLILDTYVANMEIHITKNSSINYTMGASVAVGFSMKVDNVYAYNVNFYGDIPINFGGIVAGHSWMSYINDSFAYKIFINDVETTNLIGEWGYTASNIHYGHPDFVFSEEFYLTTLKWSDHIWDFSSLDPTESQLAFLK